MALAITAVEHAEAARNILDQLWLEVLSVELPASYFPGIADVVDAIFAGNEVGYRKAIIIQLAGKAANPSLDAQSMQKRDGTSGAWDAREFAKRVFVPWNASIGNPFGDSDDPYVSNQFRNPRFDASIRGSRRKVVVFDHVLSLLELANAADNQDEIEALLREVLLGLRRFIQGKSFSYPIPQRASLSDTHRILQAFLSESSGGARLQAVAHADFLSAADAGFNYSGLVSRHVNASDASSQASGDIAFTKGGRASAVEVKDRLLTTGQVAASVTKARVNEVTELIFLVHRIGSEMVFESSEDAVASEAIAAKEFSAGLNIYWEPYLRFSRTLLTLIGEDGRRSFLKYVGVSLEEQRADAKHRWAWSQLVSSM